MESQRKVDNKNKDNPEIQKRKKEAQRVYRANKSNFDATKLSITTETGFTIICGICNRLKCPDSVKMYASLDVVPLELRVLMGTTNNKLSVCYYCKAVLKKRKSTKNK